MQIAAYNQYQRPSTETAIAQNDAIAVTYRSCCHRDAGWIRLTSSLIRSNFQHPRGIAVGDGQHVGPQDRARTGGPWGKGMGRLEPRTRIPC
jgi:hypothetical protein